MTKRLKVEKFELGDLPEDCLKFEIFEYLSIKEIICTLRFVCKNFKKLNEENRLFWRNKILGDSPQEMGKLVNLVFGDISYDFGDFVRIGKRCVEIKKFLLTENDKTQNDKIFYTILKKMKLGLSNEIKFFGIEFEKIGIISKSQSPLPFDITYRNPHEWEWDVFISEWEWDSFYLRPNSIRVGIILNILTIITRIIYPDIDSEIKWEIGKQESDWDKTKYTFIVLMEPQSPQYAPTSPPYIPLGSK